LIRIDGVAAAVYLLIFVSAAAARTDVAPGISIPLVVAMGAPVAVRRRWPVPVFLVVLAASVAALVTGVLVDPFVAAALAVYAVALEARRGWVPHPATGAVAAAAVLIGATVGGAPYPSWRRAGLAVLGAGLIIAAWTAGRIVRDRRAQATRAAAEVAGRAVAEERLRIARELHDVLAHSMSLIAVKAGTANHVMDERPEQARDAVQIIESASRTALAEMRQLLGVLRSDVDGAELAPAPDLTGLNELARRARQAGVTVDLTVHDVEAVPDAVALSAYRIVQEAVTNVIRHAAPARCSVSVVGGPDELLIGVIDDGIRASPPLRQGTGHGLIGMRERVLMYGGEFMAGPRPQGGFAVSARIPLSA
jgi:signal transduction histidine kinase